MDRKVNQIGIVVADIDEAILYYEGVLGLGKFQVIDRPVETCTLHGAESTFRVRTALGKSGDIQIELIQVLEGRSAHSEFLEKNGPGMHHLGFFVEDIDTALQALPAGTEMIARGEFLGLAWAYADTMSTAGCITEFMQLPSPKSKGRKSKP